MINEDAVRDLMLYIESHMELKQNGSFRKIKMRTLLCDKEFKFNQDDEKNPPYTREDLIIAFRHCEMKKYIAVKGPQKISNSAILGNPTSSRLRQKQTGSRIVTTSPAHQLIFNILPAGEVFLDSVRDKTLWEKIKAFHLFDKLSSLVSAGNTVADVLHLLGL